MSSEEPHLPVRGAAESKEVARSTWIKTLHCYFGRYFMNSGGRVSDGAKTFTTGWFLNPALGPVLKEASFLLALKNYIFELEMLLVQSA